MPARRKPIQNPRGKQKQTRQKEKEKRKRNYGKLSTQLRSDRRTLLGNVADVV